MAFVAIKLHEVPYIALIRHRAYECSKPFAPKREPGKIDEVEKRSLQQLSNRERPFNANQGGFGEDNGTIAHCMDHSARAIQ